MANAGCAWEALEDGKQTVRPSLASIASVARLRFGFLSGNEVARRAGLEHAEGLAPFLIHLDSQRFKYLKPQILTLISFAIHIGSV